MPETISCLSASAREGFGFTKKAAEELRSRILGWGFRIIDLLKNGPALTPDQKAFVEALDINQVRTGTVDSLCEQLLRVVELAHQAVAERGHRRQLSGGNGNSK